MKGSYTISRIDYCINFYEKHSYAQRSTPTLDIGRKNALEVSRKDGICDTWTMLVKGTFFCAGERSWNIAECNGRRFHLGVVAMHHHLHEWGHCIFQRAEIACCKRWKSLWINDNGRENIEAEEMQYLFWLHWLSWTCDFSGKLQVERETADLNDLEWIRKTNLR